MKYVGDGSFTCTNSVDRELANEKLEVDHRYKGKFTKPRSDSASGYFHKFVGKVFKNLPSDNEFKNAEHLKAYLLCRAGHCSVMEVSAGDNTEFVARTLDHVLNKFLRSEVYPLFEYKGDTLRIYRANSISKTAITAENFRPISEMALTIGAEMIGLTLDQLTTGDEGI